MPITIQYHPSKDFHHWASVGLSNNYIVPLRELLPKSIFGNLAKKIDKIAQALIDNNLNFKDLAVLNKYISDDGKLIKNASTSDEDKENLSKISCIINNKEVFKALVKTSGLLSMIGGAAGWLSMIPTVGAVASGVASAAYFASGDYTSGILYLIGIAAAFFGLGAAVKGLHILLRAAARGGGHLTRLLVSGGKLRMAQKALPMMTRLKEAIIAVMKKLGLSKKYEGKVRNWFSGKEKIIDSSITKAKKVIGTKGAEGLSGKGSSFVTKELARKRDLLIRRNPAAMLKNIKRDPTLLQKLTPLQRKTFTENIGKAGRVELKGIVERATKSGIGLGGAGSIGLTGLMGYQMLSGDKKDKTDSKDRGEGSMTGKLWDTLAKPGDGYKGNAPFMEEL